MKELKENSEEIFVTLNYAKFWNTKSKILIVVVVQLLSCLCLFETSWTTPDFTRLHQTSLSFTCYWSWLKFMFIELMMPSNHLKYQNIDILIQTIKETNDILYFIKNSALQRHLLEKSHKLTGSLWKSLIKDLYPEYRNFYTSVRSKKKKKELKNWAEDSNRCSTKGLETGKKHI